MVVEFRYISTCGERFAARARDDDTAYGGIGLEAGHDFWESLPHIEAERVAPLRRVEYEIAGRTANFGDEL